MFWGMANKKLGVLVLGEIIESLAVAGKCFKAPLLEKKSIFGIRGCRKPSIAGSKGGIGGRSVRAVVHKFMLAPAKADCGRFRQAEVHWKISRLK